MTETLLFKIVADLAGADKSFEKLNIAIQKPVKSVEDLRLRNLALKKVLKELDGSGNKGFEKMAQSLNAYRQSVQASVLSSTDFHKALKEGEAVIQSSEQKITQYNRAINGINIGSSVDKISTLHSNVEALSSEFEGLEQTTIEFKIKADNLLSANKGIQRMQFLLEETRAGSHSNEEAVREFLNEFRTLPEIYSSMNKLKDSQDGLIEKQRELASTLKSGNGVDELAETYRMLGDEGKSNLEIIQREFVETSLAVKKSRIEISREADAFKKLAEQSLLFGQSFEGIARGFKDILGIKGFTDIAKDIINVNKELSDLETNVIANTNFNKESIRDLRDELKLINTRSSEAELLKLVEVAAQIGIEGKESILQFTEVADQLNVALGSEIGDNIGSVAEQFAILKAQFEDTRGLEIEEGLISIGSAINFISSNTTASSAGIIAFTSSIGQFPNTIKPTIKETISLGALFSQLKVSSDTAAKGYETFLKSASSNIGAFASQMNITVGEAQRLLNNDLIAFTQRLGSSLANLEGTQLTSVLEDLGLAGSEVSQVFTLLANKSDELTEIQQQVSRSFEAGTSVTEEFDLKNNNLAATIDKIRNQFNQFATSNEFIAFLENASNRLLSFSGNVLKLGEFLLDNRNVILTLVAAYGIYRTSLTAVAFAQNLQRLGLISIATGAKAAAASQSLLTLGTKGATIAFRAFNLAIVISPLGLLVGAIGLAVGAMSFLASSTEDSTDAFDSNTGALGKNAQATNELREKINDLGVTASIAAKGTNDRKKAIEEIQKLYPSFLGNVNAETVSYGQLRTALQEVNKELQNKAILESGQQSVLNAEDALAKNKQTINDLEVQIKGAALDIENDFEDIDLGINLSDASIEDVERRLRQIKKDVSPDGGFGAVPVTSNELRQLTSVLNLIHQRNEAVKQSSDLQDQVNISQQNYNAFIREFGDTTGDVKDQIAKLKLEAQDLETQLSVGSDIGISIGVEDVNAEDLQNELTQKLDKIEGATISIIADTEGLDFTEIQARISSFSESTQKDINNAIRSGDVDQALELFKKFKEGANNAFGSSGGSAGITGGAASAASPAVGSIEYYKAQIELLRDRIVDVLTAGGSLQDVQDEIQKIAGFNIEIAEAQELNTEVEARILEETNRLRGDVDQSLNDQIKSKKEELETLKNELAELNNRLSNAQTDDQRQEIRQEIAEKKEQVELVVVEISGLENAKQRANDFINVIADKVENQGKASLNDLIKVEQERLDDLTNQLNDLNRERQQSTDPAEQQRIDREISRTELEIKTIRFNIEGLGEAKAKTDEFFDTLDREDEDRKFKIEFDNKSEEEKKILTEINQIRNDIINAGGTEAEQLQTRIDLAEILKEKELELEAIRLRQQIKDPNTRDVQRLAAEQRLTALLSQQSSERIQSLRDEATFTADIFGQSFTIIKDKAKLSGEEVANIQQENLRAVAAVAIQQAQQLSNQFFDQQIQSSQERRDQELAEADEKEQSELERNEALRENGVITEEEFQKRKVGIEEKYEKQREGIRKKAFQEEKRLKLAQALINGALAVSLVYATTPPPVSFAAVVPVIAATAAAIAQIVASKFAEGGLFDLPEVPQFFKNGNNTIAKGAYLSRGRPHSSGGMPILDRDGGRKVAEIELDESIINARSTRKFLRELSIINQAEGGVRYPGTPSINSFQGQEILRRLRPAKFELGGLFTSHIPSFSLGSSAFDYPASNYRFYVDGGLFETASANNNETGEVIESINNVVGALSIVNRNLVEYSNYEQSRTKVDELILEQQGILENES